MGFYATTEVKEKNRYYPVFCSDKPENRLVTAGKSGAGVPPAEKIRIEFAYDANGNITAYADTNANIVAAYEYDPFGNTIAASGSKADDFAFRFSTKYLDPETDWYYYGYRYYSPNLGRWPSRDPIGERGGLNVYTGMLNALINLTDAFGLQSAVRWNDVYQGAPAKFNRSGKFFISVNLVNRYLGQFTYQGSRQQFRTPYARQMKTAWDEKCQTEHGSAYKATDWKFHVTQAAMTEGIVNASLNISQRRSPRLGRIGTYIRYSYQDETGNIQRKSEMVAAPINQPQIVLGHMAFKGYWSWQCRCADTGAIEERRFSEQESFHQSMQSGQHIPVFKSDVDLAFSAFQPIVANRVEELRNLYGERLDNIAVSPFGESGRVTAFGSIPPFVDETPDRQ